MEWTNRKPESVGLYWLIEYGIVYNGSEKREGFKGATIVSVEDWEDEDCPHLEVMGLGDECGMGKVDIFDKRCSWYGPISPPPFNNPCVSAYTYT